MVPGGGGEQVGVRGVGDVGEVEEICVGADLEVRAAADEDVEDGGQELDVARPEEAGGGEGGG